MRINPNYDYEEINMKQNVKNSSHGKSFIN